MGKRKVVIATRGSRLALWQANWIKAEIEKEHSEIIIELNKIKTTGDKILDVPLAKVGGKGLFVKEIEEALIRGDADLAVHSMKDVPADLPEGLHISAITKREDPRDALLTRTQSTPKSFATGPRRIGISAPLRQAEHRAQMIKRLKDLPHGAHVGTSSLRRSCQLLSKRPDLKITQLRGNLDTRIRKLDEGLYDAIIVASAGVKRLGMADRITEILEPDISLPAIGQGAVGIECRTDDGFINNLILPLNHPETSVCVQAERAFLRKLEGGCQVPIAGYAQLLGTKDEGRRMKGESTLSPISHLSSLVIDGLVGSLSGDTIIRGSIKGNADDAEQLGIQLAEDLISRGAGKILAEVYNR